MTNYISQKKFFIVLVWLLSLVVYCQSSAELCISDTKISPINDTPIWSNDIDLNTPLSQQNWKKLDFTKLSLNELSQIYNLEYQNSQNLIDNLQNQLLLSKNQILSLGQSLQSTQEELLSLQDSLNLSVQGITNINDFVNSMTKENAILTKKLHNMYWIIGITTIGAIISSPLIVEGIQTNNSILLWSGIGVGISSAIAATIKNFI